jgi:chemotaxis protein histidine kinase CheA
MDRNKLSQAGVLYEEGLARFMGRAAAYEKYIRLFPRDSAFADLKAAMQKGDADAAFLAAHTIKGTAGLLSFETLTKKVSPLVEALRAKNMEQAEGLYSDFAAAYDTLVAVIEAQQDGCE